jgi:hypothetical protein
MIYHNRQGLAMGPHEDSLHNGMVQGQAAGPDGDHGSISNIQLNAQVFCC